MKRCILIGAALFLSSPVLADDVGSSVSNSTPTTTTAPQSEQQPKVAKMPEDTPEDKAFKAEMIKRSDAISQKISQIQAKQKEIDDEVYLAYKPPLIADKATLESELRDLEQARDKLQAQKTARDLTNQLKNANTSSPQQ